MELLAILMSGLLAAGSPIGLIVEEITGDRLSERLYDAETLEIRIDNLPAHQIAKGEIDKLRLATRGVEIFEGIRFETLEVETDSLDLDLQQIRQGKFSADSIEKPVQAGIRMVITETDLNNALRSPQVRLRLQPLVNRLLTRPGSPKPPQFTLNSTSVDFVGENRFEFRGDISQVNPQTGEFEEAELKVAYTLQLTSGTEFAWLDPVGSVNTQQLPLPALTGFARGMSRNLNLQRLQEQGLTARFLAMHMDEDQWELAMFLGYPTQKQQAQSIPPVAPGTPRFDPSMREGTR